MEFNIDKQTVQNKSHLLEHFRKLVEEKRKNITKKVNNAPQKLSNEKHKLEAKEINTAIYQIKEGFVRRVIETARENNWNDQEKLSSLLFVVYCSQVVMLDLRHQVWAYEYMAFSRRVGELWEDFVKLPFLHPPRTVDLVEFVPPLFSDVIKNLKQSTEEYISVLPISLKQKHDLMKYYEKVWVLINTGNISLELDFHATIRGKKFNIDFKSGFGSNEKGNTNRMLMIATIYCSLSDEYNNVLFIRAEEDSNNHYFRTLKESGVWSAYCGHQAYRKIADFTEFDIHNWINSNIDWEHDLLNRTVQDFTNRNLMGYLQW
ncbi:hypothetical protein [Cylindrospermopsis raciborskii]|jgi:hypothetical protein|uniref:hypothetical protein n=1 Tax=Cylindrospermopsis raciborskii TaxID=77022 RepID=UPI001F2221D7|nr:hypothetical protein [Cylindrospermopsis raciborskii]UJS03461.1 hypothetical protein L3I90_10005 [Cylindrospermopsis raciborskii KLL07]